MFDSKEIAKRALLRAEEIKATKKRRNKWWKSAMLVGMCAASVLIVITIFPLSKLPDDDYILVDNDQIPLAAFTFPYEEAENYPSCMIPGYDSVTIPADTLNVKIVLLNPEGNDCWFTFEIVLQDTGETLYISEPVAPSMSVEDVTLAREIPKGEYKALMIIRAYESENFSEINGASVAFDIIAE